VARGRIVTIGRVREVEGWSARLTDGLRSGPTAVLIEGEPGVGKTTVWASVVDHASVRGIRVLRSRPSEPETAVSYSAVGDLMTDIADGQLASLPEPQRRALEIACLRREPVRPVDDVRLIGTALASVLRTVTRSEPVVLAIDDAQWLDLPSASALTYGLRRLAGERLGVLLTRRSNGSPEPPLGLGDPSSWSLERAELGPLDPGPLAELIKARLGLELSRRRSRRLHALSGGNPLLALEMARAVAGADDDAGIWRALARSADIASVIGRRIAIQPPRTRLALAAAAALSEPSLDQIASVLGSARSAAIALRNAESAAIVHLDGRRIRFEHPLLAAASYGALGEAERFRLQRILADTVADPEVRARHLALGHSEPDEQAAAAISAGAQRASARGAQDAAADLAEAALRLTPPDDLPAVGQRTMAAAVHHARAGELRRARWLCEQLLPSVPAGHLRSGILRLIGESHLQEESFSEGVEALRQAAAEAGDDPEVRLPIDLRLAYALVNGLRPHDARVHGRRAAADARRISSGPLIAIGLAVEEITRFFVGRPARPAALERALALEARDSEEPALLRPSLIVGLIDCVTGRHRRAKALFAGIVDAARTLGDDASLVPALMYESWAAVLCGEIDAARSSAEEAASVAHTAGTPIARAHALLATGRVAVLVEEGETARSDALLAEELYRAAGATSDVLLPIGLRSSLAWALDDAASTVSILGGPLEEHLAAGFTVAMHAFVVDLLEAHIALGNEREARELVRRFEAAAGHGGPFQASVAGRGRALLLAREGRLREALAEVEDALRELTKIDPLPYEVARTLLVKGRIERRMKRRASARTTLEAARDGFAGLGARHWVARTEAELDRIGGPAPDELTPAERRVAELAARGLTNKQVAVQAFVTPKSVEGILDRVYGKLGIHSRAELGAWAAARNGGRAGRDADR
jgi:DNA-binding CsgD family transcriptional regulator